MTQPSSITPASVRGRWLALPLAFALGLAGTVNAETVVLPARKPLHPIDAPASGIHVRSVELPDEMSSVTGTPFTSSAVLDRSFGILIGGSFSVAGAQNIMRVAPQGDFDPNFARLTLNDRVFAIANHVNGSGYYISGAFDEVRLDGTVVDDHRHAMSIHYGGGAPTIEGGLLTRLDGFARLMLESSFHSQGNTRQLFIGGDFHAANGSTVHLLGRFNTTGGLLAAYDIDDGNQVRTLASYPDGRVLVGGMFPAPGSPGHYSIVRLNPDGSRDPSFLASATEGTGRVNVIAIQPDGRIVIGGNFQYVNNVARNNLARLHPDGTLDPTFQANTDGDVYSILLLGGGEMFVGGHFTSIQGSTASGPLALLQADGTPWVVTPADGAVYGLTGTSRTDMIVTGGFTQLGGGPTPHRFGIASVIHPSNSEQFVVQPDGSSLVFRLKRNGLLSLPARTFILALDARATSLPCHGDAEQLARVVANLVGNALKFTPRGGRVRVRTVHDDRRIGFRVDDSGPGIDAQWRERIFDRFQLTGNATLRAQEGTGIGLALCNELVRLHDGGIEAGDSDLGGACFTVWLPAHARGSTAPLVGFEPDAREDAPATTASADERPPSTPADPDDGSQRPLLLVIEDQDDLRLYLAELLAGDYRVATACNGEEALARIPSLLPDAIVSDVVMPERDGLSLVAALRANGDLAGIPVLLLTARTGVDDQVTGLATGADHYLTKPFDSQVLRAHVADMLATRLRLQRLLQCAPSSPAPSSSRRPLAQRIDEALQGLAHQPETSVAELAHATHVSERSLRRHCQELFGMTPLERLRQHRLIRARGLLEQGAGTVSEIAYAVGYGNLAAFSRAYREHFGVAPSTHLGRKASTSPCGRGTEAHPGIQ